MWSLIALGMIAWFAVAAMTCLAIGRAIRLRDLFDASAVPVLDVQPKTTTAYARSRRLS